MNIFYAKVDKKWIECGFGECLRGKHWELIKLDIVETVDLI